MHVDRQPSRRDCLQRQIWSGNIDAGLTSLTFQPTPATIKGLRIIDAPSNSSRRLRALLAARGLGKRLERLRHATLPASLVTLVTGFHPLTIKIRRR